MSQLGFLLDGAAQRCSDDSISFNLLYHLCLYDRKAQLSIAIGS